MSKNIIDSVRADLTKYAKANERPFQEVLQYYGIERFLYRLSCSPHKNSFILKGALMLRVWDASTSRPTRDIDFLGFGSNDITDIEATVRDICETPVSKGDGLLFDGSTVKGVRITEGADYQGVRVKLLGRLGKSRIPIQMDIGFGDVVHPKPENRAFPVILNDSDPPQLRMYPPETVVAEKFEAMVKNGLMNSRMKDFYDIWLLAERFGFSGEALANAVAATFENRGTELDSEPIALSPEFAESPEKQRQWAAFLKRSNIEASHSLAQVIESLCIFLLPVSKSVNADAKFQQQWTPGSPWESL